MAHINKKSIYVITISVAIAVLVSYLFLSQSSIHDSSSYQITVTSDKEVYIAGEPITITIKSMDERKICLGNHNYLNITSTEKKYSFPTSGGFIEPWGLWKNQSITRTFTQITDPNTYEVTVSYLPGHCPELSNEEILRGERLISSNIFRIEAQNQTSVNSKIHEITIYTDKIEYKKGEIINVTLKNSGNVPITYTYGNSLLGFKNLDDNAIKFPQSGGFPGKLVLEPGDEVQKQIDTAQLPGLTLGNYEISSTYGIRQDDSKNELEFFTSINHLKIVD